MKKCFFCVGRMVGVFLLLLNSCSDNALLEDGINASEREKAERVMLRNANEDETEKYLVQFAEVLSKAVYEREDVRAFLKKESLKQFDKNYDVLYELVKEETINGKSFRDILVSYSSDKIIREIETNVSLLNILVPKIALFKVEPENLNTEDNEIPVAISRDSETSLYLNGKKELSLQKGEVPSFHVFVVNENSRVVAVNEESEMLASTGSTKAKRVRSMNTGTNRKSIIFKSPNFDGGNNSEAVDTRLAWVGSDIVGEKELEAFEYFYTNDGSVNQKALQRDYIYYGITPQKTSGSLNRSISEYISFLEINPKTYFKISDQRDSPSPNKDPYIKEDEIVNMKRELSEAELVDRMWTKGAYEFRFEIVTSTNQHPYIVYIPLRPDEIWDFHIDYEYIHHTFFRHSKHIYKIDPNKFTAKRVNLTPNRISFGKWHLAEESIYRYVTILEEDESIENTYENEYETTRVQMDKFKGDVKVGLGLGKININGGVETEKTETNSIREKKKVIVRRKEASDHLGSVRIYFYDPIIENVLWKGVFHEVYTYNTGIVTFGISVR